MTTLYLYARQGAASRRGWSLAQLVAASSSAEQLEPSLHRRPSEPRAQAALTFLSYPCPLPRRSIRSRPSSATGTSGSSGSARRCRSSARGCRRWPRAGWRSSSRTARSSSASWPRRRRSPSCSSRCTPGWFVDRTDKLRLVRDRADAAGLQAAPLWWFTWSGHITVGWLLVFALVNGRHQRVRDSGAPVARHRAGGPGGSAGRHRAQLERLQPGARRRPEHRRDRHRAARHRVVLRRQRAELRHRARGAVSRFAFRRGLPPERLVAPLDGIREGCATCAARRSSRRSWSWSRCTPCSACRTSR